MSKIRIKNFGPIKEGLLEDDGFLDIKKVTIFIGNQGSGKSTVAKLISLMTWWEKRGNRTARRRFSKSIIDLYSKFQGISDYFYTNTVIDYCGDKFTVQYLENDEFLVNIENPVAEYITPKIMYVPAERNTLSTISKIYGVTGMPEHLFTFSEELRRSNSELDSEKLKLPIGRFEYEYDKEHETTFIVGSDYKINILNSSSGIQSFAPLYVVSQNLANLVTQSDEVLRKSLKAESIFRMNEEMASLEDDDSIAEIDKIIKRKEIKAKYLPKCFINIVEEPEQNLYPTSQRQILNSLLEFNNLSEGNKLIMTTHSPYIINYLSLAIQADYLKGKIHSDELLEKLNAIVPLKSTISASDVAIYQMDERDGTIRKLSTFEGIPSDKNLLNQSLADGNDLFDQLLEIEQEL